MGVQEKSFPHFYSSFIGNYDLDEFYYYFGNFGFFVQHMPAVYFLMAVIENRQIDTIVILNY